MVRQVFEDWSVEDENRFKQMLQAGKYVRVIAKVLGRRVIVFA